MVILEYNLEKKKLCSSREESAYGCDFRLDFCLTPHFMLFHAVIRAINQSKKKSVVNIKY